jgi:hypothetical protein
MESSASYPVLFGDISPVKAFEDRLDLPTVSVLPRQWDYVRSRPSCYLSESPLVALAGHQEIWNAVCEHCSGNGVMCLSNVKPFRCATRGSPAFVFLSGRDLDGFLVPWTDRSNVLAVSYKGWNPEFHFRVMMDDRTSGLYRSTEALCSVDDHMTHGSPSNVLSAVSNVQLNFTYDLFRAPRCSCDFWLGHSCGRNLRGSHGGPARPSSPTLHAMQGACMYHYPIHTRDYGYVGSPPALFP